MDTKYIFNFKDSISGLDSHSSFDCEGKGVGFKDIRDNLLKWRISTKLGTRIPWTTLSSKSKFKGWGVSFSQTERPLQGNLDKCSKITYFHVVITEK